MDNKKINVLWVEDNPGIVDSYQRQASRFGLNLLHFPFWEDAEAALISNYGDYHAIILDAKCPVKKNDIDDADVFLSYAIDRIREISYEKHRIIPWYVLSGDAERDISRIIPSSRKKWDEDWDKTVNRPFYSKKDTIKYGGEETPERQVLFKRIKSYVDNYNEELALRYNHYPDVFKATQYLLDLGMDGEVERCLIRLLAPIHFKGLTNKEYNDLYKSLRIMIEFIFQHMLKMKILPPKIKYKGEINLSWSSTFLGGEFDEHGVPKSDKKLWNIVIRNTKDNKPLLPKQLSEFLKVAIFESGAALHTSDEESQKMNFAEYMECVNHSPYKLQSLALASCDFILWYYDFVKKNPDEEMNAVNLWTLSNSSY